MSMNSQTYGEKWPDECFVGGPNELLRCPICYWTMKDAVMCPEQHAFCHDCLDKCVTDLGRCPICNKSMQKSDIKPARIVRNMIDSLEIVCLFDGCDEKVTIGNALIHASQCSKGPIKCSSVGCDAFVPRAGMDEHLKECGYAKVKCENPMCQARLLRKDLAEHCCLDELKAYYEQKLDEMKQYVDRQIQDALAHAPRVITAAPQSEALVNQAFAKREKFALSSTGTTVDRINLPINGPKILQSMPFSRPSSWSWKIKGNSSIEFGIGSASQKHTDEAMHKSASSTVGVSSSSTSGSKQLPIKLNRDDVITVTYDGSRLKIQVTSKGSVTDSADLLMNHIPGPEYVFLITMWRGGSLIRQPIETAVAPIQLAASSSSLSNCRHRFETRNCRICVQCLKCTGFGSSCCVSGPVASQHKSGQECGCGSGDAGCVLCGICKQCAGVSES